MSENLDKLHRIINSRFGFKIHTIYDPYWVATYGPRPEGQNLTYMVEVEGPGIEDDPTAVYAQGYGSTLDAAAKACLSSLPKDWS
jgi:hypothetical protein